MSPKSRVSSQFSNHYMCDLHAIPVQVANSSAHLWHRAHSGFSHPLKLTVAFLALDRVLISSFIQVFWLGNDFNAFLITTTVSHLPLLD